MYAQERASQVVLVVKNLPASAGDIRDVGSLPGLGRSGVGNGNPLQYSCLENLHGQRSLTGYRPCTWQKVKTRLSNQAQYMGQHADC